MTHLTRWFPNRTRDLLVFDDEVNRMFEGFLQRGDAASTLTPAVDLAESDSGFTIKMDLPGVQQKDVKVSVTGDTLTIRGERLETKVENGNLHHRERRFGSFERTFKLGTPFHKDRIQAVYKDGVLEVQVPKSDDAKVREIEIQVGS